MSIKLKSSDGNVSIEVDSGSTVSNVTVDGRTVSIGRPKRNWVRIVAMVGWLLAGVLWARLILLLILRSL